jgi:adenosylcobinamide hydrolase
VILEPDLVEHDAGDRTRPVLVWRFPTAVASISTAILGGGVGPRSWIVNVEVPRSYDRVDVADHLAQVAAEAGCAGAGVGLVTAASVSGFTIGYDGEVEVVATVGLAQPTWAAGPDDSWSPWRPGTVNIVAWIPVALTGAALVNAVVTVTEAKTQALVEAGVPGTGTASDAVCVCCPAVAEAGELFAGPRSRWGARLARATHAAVSKGIS